MKKLVILGTGGNCIDILDAVNEINENNLTPIYQCVGFLDDCQDCWGKSYQGISVLGSLDRATEFPDFFFVNGIGSPSNFWKKKSIISKTQIPQERFVTIVHPASSVSKMSKLGPGTVVLANATIASHVTIGNHVIILPNAVISHDCSIGNYTCITSGVCISGGVKIGNSCYLGTNSSILGDISIGDYSLVGMGSVVLDTIEENSVVVGNPAKVLRKTMAPK
jgi:sugar O-acyltransferase (sialic acid O-acetyltransferase NeuD family)